MRQRRTQEERSAETRKRLLEATLACLVEVGWARTTTTEIAARAGVSRGAQLHHYPTKAELVLSAVEYLFARRDDEFRAAFNRLPARADRGAAALDLLWEIVSGPTFAAWLELAVAARTDPELRRAVFALGRRSAENVDRTFRELFPAPEPPNALFQLAPKIAFAFLHGLAIERLLVEAAPAEQRAVLDVLKRLAVLALPAAIGSRRRARRAERRGR